MQWNKSDKAWRRHHSSKDINKHGLKKCLLLALLFMVIPLHTKKYQDNEPIKLTFYRQERQFIVESKT